MSTRTDENREKSALPLLGAAPARSIRAFPGAAILVVLFWPILAAQGQEPFLPPAALEEADEECIACHEDLDPDEKEFKFPGGEIRTFDVSGERIRSSLHGKILTCVACHDGYDDRHEGFPEESARAYDLARSALCKRCHEDVAVLHTSAAGSGPICTDCHSAHGDAPPEEGAPRFSKRCGSCHEVGLKEFEAGGHAAGISEENLNRDLPNCSTCHPQHGHPASQAMGTRMEVTAQCIECHSRELVIRKYGLTDDAAESYGADFHGMTFQHLWAMPPEGQEPQIMVCVDCHGPHRVGRLAQADLSGVCNRCHEDADQALAGAWLGHEPPGPRNSTVVWLVRILYYVSIPVVVIGLLLNILLHGRYRLRNNPIPDRWARGNGDGGSNGEGKLPASVIRFRPVERLEHLFGMTLFTALVLTGLPQAYPQASAGQWLIEFFGGIEFTRTMHRAAGFTFAALALLHVARGVLGAIRKNRLPAMVPTRQDFLDALGTLKYYLGRGEHPKFGRFDYRQKFEYWGLFLGGILMTATGLILVYPELVSHLLPGVFIAAARVAHGLEATLAVLVVVTWHFYEVLLRPEIFPLDTTIFTGKMRVDRLREEHALEYDRLIEKVTHN